MTGSGPASAPLDVLVRVRSVKGTTLIVVINVILAAVFALNFFAARRNNAEEKMRREDATTLHDPARIVETWKPLPDGMELTVRPVDASDSARRPTGPSLPITQRKSMRLVRRYGYSGSPI